MHDWHVQTTPLVHAYAVSNRLGGDCEDGRVVTDKDDATGRRDGCLNDSHNVGNGQASKQRPHGKVLKARWGRGELVAKSIVLHVDPDKVVEARRGKAQNPRDLLGMEQVGSLVPVNPHAPEVVTQQVVEWVPGEEGQAVWNPVCLISVVVEVGLGPLPEVADSFGALLVGS